MTSDDRKLVLVVDADQRFIDGGRALFHDHRVLSARDLDEAREIVLGGRVDLVVLGPAFASEGGVAAAAGLHHADPTVELVLAADVVTNRLLKAALRGGFADVVDLPLTPAAVALMLGSGRATTPAEVEIVVEPATTPEPVAVPSPAAPPAPTVDAAPQVPHTPMPAAASPFEADTMASSPVEFIPAPAPAWSEPAAPPAAAPSQAPVAPAPAPMPAPPEPIVTAPPAATQPVAPEPVAPAPAPVAPSQPIEATPAWFEPTPPPAPAPVHPGYTPVSHVEAPGQPAVVATPPANPMQPTVAAPPPMQATPPPPPQASQPAPPVWPDPPPRPMAPPPEDRILPDPTSPTRPERPATPPPPIPLADRAPGRPRHAGGGRVIAVMAGKGGSGKSVVATNLAIALGMRHDPERVAIVDADLQFGDIALMLQIEPTRTIDDLVGHLDSMSDSRLDAALLRHESGLRVLPAPLLPVRSGEIPAKSVVEIVDRLRSLYDTIVVDTGPVFDDGLVTILENADAVVTVVDMDLPSVKNAKVALDALRGGGFPMDRITLVVNRVNSKARLDLVELERSLGLRVGGSVPSDRLVPQSVNEGIPLLALSPRSKVARSFMALAERLDPTASRDRITGGGR